MSTFANDYRNGMIAEDDFLKLFNEKYPDFIKKNSNKRGFFDFVIEDAKVLLELKSRNVKKDKYPTTLMPYHKINRFITFNENRSNQYIFIFLFKFLDGLYFFTHKDDYEYDVRKFSRAPRSDYYDRSSDYIYLDVKELRPISEMFELLEILEVIRIFRNPLQ